MTMKTKIIILFCALLCVATASVIKDKILSPRARITARVVDEQGTPLAGVRVRFIFGTANDSNAIVRVEGETRNDGLFSGEGYSRGGYGVSISKEGYYNSGLDAPKLVDIKDGRWLPWNPVVTTTLRPIVNPVAMYARQAWIVIPTVDTPCGYDLEVGDWVAPYGKGKIKDLIFKLTQRYGGVRDFDTKVEISFSNPQDGIQEVELPSIGRTSAYKWPREAPDNGYGRMLTTSFSWMAGGKMERSANENQAYFFRIRTEMQNGKLSKARYGKIRGGLFLAPYDSETCKVQITYYLNPTSMDRNMEWKVGDNLLELEKDKRGNKLEEPRDP
jgi:hypothetical protein